MAAELAFLQTYAELRVLKSPRLTELRVECRKSEVAVGNFGSVSSLCLPGDLLARQVKIFTEGRRRAYNDGCC